MRAVGQLVMTMMTGCVGEGETSEWCGVIRPCEGGYGEVWEVIKAGGGAATTGGQMSHSLSRDVCGDAGAPLSPQRARPRTSCSGSPVIPTLRVRWAPLSAACRFRAQGIETIPSPPVHAARTFFATANRRRWTGEFQSCLE
jgi:hypothetical protein